MHTGWTGYLMLRSKMSIHDSGREHLALGHAVGSGLESPWHTEFGQNVTFRTARACSSKSGWWVAAHINLMILYKTEVAYQSLKNRRKNTKYACVNSCMHEPDIYILAIFKAYFRPVITTSATYHILPTQRKVPNRKLTCMTSINCIADHHISYTRAFNTVTVGNLHVPFTNLQTIFVELAEAQNVSCSYSLLTKRLVHCVHRHAWGNRHLKHHGKIIKRRAQAWLTRFPGTWSTAVLSMVLYLRY